MRKKKRTEQFKLGIADITISLVSDDNVRFCIDDDHYSFATESKPEVIFKIYAGHISHHNAGKEIFSTDTTWKLFRKNGKVIVKTTTRTAILQSDFKAGDIYIWPKPAGCRFSFPLNYPLGEILMINLLSKGRGVMVHACGVDDSGYGCLFLGNSARGKSTMAKLWSKSHATVLSDDRIIVREKDGEFWIYGTPWHGDAKVCSPEKVPLKKIFFLKHARKNTAKKITSTAAISRLITCSFPTFWDKKGMKFTLRFCAELIQKIPCYELGFVPDENVLDFVRTGYEM